MITPRHRRIVASLLLAAYAVAATGLPLRGPQPPRVAGERFPCEACSCGCASADVCWTNCCCHTLGERLAWADRENVRPPEFVLDQARCAGLDVRRWLGDAAPRVLVALPAKASPAKSCCCSAKTAAPQPTADPAPEDPDNGAQSWRSLACHSVLSLWVSLSVALPPEPVAAAPSPPAVATRLAPAPLFRGVSEPPMTPPPERLS